MLGTEYLRRSLLVAFGGERGGLLLSPLLGLFQHTISVDRNESLSVLGYGCTPGTRSCSSREVAYTFGALHRMSHAPMVRRVESSAMMRLHHLVDRPREAGRRGARVPDRLVAAASDRMRSSLSGH